MMAVVAETSGACYGRRVIVGRPKGKVWLGWEGFSRFPLAAASAVPDGLGRLCFGS